MSRLGKLPIHVPAGVKTVVQNGMVNVEGPKGKLSIKIPEGVDVLVEGAILKTTRKSDSKAHRAKHGMIRSLVYNMVKGVSQGYEKRLLINGVGYRAAVKG